MLRICNRALWAGLLYLIFTALLAACDAGGAEPSQEFPDGSNAAMLLRGLPADSSQFAFAEIDLVLQRPAMREEVEDSFDELSNRSYDLIDAEFLVDAEIKSIAVGITDENASATVLLGNFDGFLGTLRKTPSLVDARGRFDPPGVIDPHRDLELFVFPHFSDLFMAVPDTKTLLLADNPELLKKLIDRHFDRGELNQLLAGLLSRVERVDFLVAFTWDVEGAEQNNVSSPPPPNIYAHSGFFNEGETSTIYAYKAYVSDSDAEEAFDFQSKQPNISNLFFRYNRETVVPVGELWKDGPAIIAKAVVPDKDISDLFLPD